jgi:hypothetical protein
MLSAPGKLALARLLWGTVIACALVACGKHAGKDPSNTHLQEGLQALDRGDDETAERELHTALAERPKNADARVALASIYARRAGFPMKVWLDPLMEAGKQVDSKMRAYETAGDIAGRLADSQVDDGDDEIIAPDPKSKDLRELKERIRSVYANLGKYAVSVMVAIDLFEALPYLDDGQMANLNLAIETLRADDPNPDLRSPKVKVYLAALATMKFVHHLRNFVGSFDHEAKKAFTQSSRFCTMDAPAVRANVTAIHDALVLVEEGLRVRGTDDANEVRLRARRQLHDFVKQRLLGDAWNNVEKFFEKGSEQNYAVMRFASRLCGVGKKPGKGAGSPPVSAPLPGGPAGANLWNPDEEDAQKR